MVRILGCFLSLLFMAVPAASQGGELVVRAGGHETVYSTEKLEELGLTTVETTTTWTDGVQNFDGVLLSRLAKAHGIESGVLGVAALNGYEAEIDVSEILAYPVVIATRYNGAHMSVRDKGPYWIIYPRDEYAEFQDERHNYKWVWQVRSLEFR